MKFMILIHSNPKSRQMWSEFTDAQRKAGVEYYAELAGELTQSGELITTEALAAPAHGKWIAPTDGPFAEVKEYLAGFFLIDCVDFGRAMEIASRVPEAELGLVEVRPVIGASDLL